MTAQINPPSDDVDVLTVPAPLSTTGSGTEATAQRVTIATDSTGVLSVDDNGGSLTVDGTVAVSGTVTVGSHAVTNAGTFAVQDAAAEASLSVLDDWDESDRAKVNPIVGQAGIAAGTGVDGVTVPRVSLATNVALPAGTNAIGKLAANSGVDIGDVDVTSLPALPAGTNNIGDVDVLSMPDVTIDSGSLGTQYTEDAALGSTGTGTLVVARRDDALSTLTPVADDAVGLRVGDKGALWVQISDGSGAQITSFGGGDATAANQTTIIGHLDGVEGLLGTIDADTGAIMTAVQVLDNAIAGTEMQVDVVAALPAGTNNIGDVDVLTLPALVAGSANIGDVDVLTVPADPFGVNADAASATGSISAKLRFIAGTGIPITGTVTVGAHAVTNAGTFVTQENGAALTALQLMDDPVQVLGTDTYTEATSKGITIGAVRRDADTTLVGTTNEFGPLQMDANGRLKVEAFSGETLPVSLASLPALVAGTANIGDVDVLTLPALVAGTANIGDVDVLTLPALPAGTNNIGDVDVLSIVPGTGATNLGKAIDSAVGATDTGVGALVKRLDTPVTLTPASGDWVPLQVNSMGEQYVVNAPHFGLVGDPYSLLSETAQYTSAQTGVAFVTPTSGKKLVVTKVQIQIGGTVAGTWILWFGGSGDTTYTRGTDRAIFDGEFAPSATSKPGVVMDGPWIAGAADDILRVTGVGAISLQTCTVWYYEI